MTRNLEFKKLFLSSLLAVVVSVSIGVFLAYQDFGIWALIVQQLLNITIVPIVLLFTVRWRPRMLFSMGRIVILLSFGWKLLVSALIDTLFRDLRP